MDRAAFLFGRDELASGSTAVRSAPGTKKPPFPAVFASFLIEGKWCQKRTRSQKLCNFGGSCRSKPNRLTTHSGRQATQLSGNYLCFCDPNATVAYRPSLAVSAYQVMCPAYRLARPDNRTMLASSRRAPPSILRERRPVARRQLPHVLTVFRSHLDAICPSH